MSSAEPAFGRLLKDYRLAVGLTQEALAERAGLSTRVISDLERGVIRMPRQETLDLLVQALALSPRQRVLLIAAARPLAASAATLDATIHPPHNLPVPPTPLIGRESDVTRAATLLSRAEVRLLTLTGPSGVGKTRLGLQVAEDLLDRFEEGVWVVELAPLCDVSLVVPTIAQTLGLSTSAGQPPQELVKAALGQQRVLLVLDNFEHVGGAAPQIAGLLGACPRLKLLVTSRAALHVRGEYELAVAPLEQEAAITLFLQRAQAVQPALVFTLENIQAATAICQRLDRLPLALELAAAHVKVLPPPTLLERLTSRFAWLRGGAVDLPERQRTMLDAIAWSYDLLRKPEQQLFRRLAVFVGGCALEAAEVVCGEEAEGYPATMLERLEALIDTSLLHTEPLRAPRFTMLETIRDYALERLHESGEAETLSRRHLAYYLRLAEEAARIGPEQDERDARMWREVTNVRAALEWARECQESGLGLQLLVACARIWYYRGMAGELVQWFENLLAVDATAGARAASATLRVQALYGLARTAKDEGQYERVEQLAREGLELAERVGDQRGMGNALRLLGEVAQARADLPEATRLFERGLACSREAGDPGGVDMALMSLGHLAHAQGDYVRATRMFEEALARARAINLTWGVANVLTGLALVARDQGDYQRALALYRESLGIHQTFGNLAYLAWDFEGLAAVIGALGDAAHATQLSAAAEQLRAKVHAPRPPAEQEGFDHMLDAARDALEQEAFEQAWATGTTLTPEAAMTLALSIIAS